MINGVYLSEAIDINDLKYNCINLIKTNCSSGKTYFSLNLLSQKAKNLSNVVYLTDSAAQRDSLSKEENCKIYNSSDKEIMNGDIIKFDKGKIIVMTYAKMGLLLKYFPKAFDAVEIIICDEIHRIYDFIEMSRKDARRHFPGTTPKEIDYWISVSCGAYLAATQLERMASGLSLDSDNKSVVPKLIVGLSATPTKAYTLFAQQINDIRINAQLVAYETLRTIYYTNLATVIANMEKGIKVIFYVPHISDIIKSIEFAKAKGFSANGIWSLNNNEYKMDKEQLRIRDYILEEHKLPEEYDFIFINAAYETSINIYGNINCMVIHTKDTDSRIQARNRYRGDLETQYLLADSGEKITLKVPVEYLNVPLNTEKKKELCSILGFRNKTGDLVGWTTTKKYLIEMGYEIKDCKPTINGKRVCCSMIIPKE